MLLREKKEKTSSSLALGENTRHNAMGKSTTD
jgi:hypothetical protein